MKYYVMSFPWMFVIYCWVDHDNMIEMWFMMGEITRTP
jgi:hypothetical protein